MAELILRDGVGMIDLVAEDDEGDLRELLHREERIQLRLGLWEPLVILGVDEEYDTVDFGEVVLPETSS